MEGEETVPAKTLNVYGFVMLDSGYDFGTNDPNWFDVVRPSKLPLVATGFYFNRHRNSHVCSRCYIPEISRLALIRAAPYASHRSFLFSLALFSLVLFAV